jgi:hypothetical protein
VVSAADKDPRLVEVIRSKYTAAWPLTDVMLLKLHADGAFPLSDEDATRVERLRAEDAASPTVTNVSDKTQSLRGKFGKRAQKLAGQLIDPKVNLPAFRDLVAGLQARAKEMAGVSAPVPTIDDPVVLERLMQALEQAFQEVVGHVPAPAP